MSKEITALVPAAHISRLIDNLEAAIEYTQELLDEYDHKYERRIPKYQLWAETMEADIASMQQSLAAMKSYDVP